MPQPMLILIQNANAEISKCPFQGYDMQNITDISLY